MALLPRRRTTTRALCPVVARTARPRSERARAGRALTKRPSITPLPFLCPAHRVAVSPGTATRPQPTRHPRIRYTLQPNSQLVRSATCCCTLHGGSQIDRSHFDGPMTPKSPHDAAAVTSEVWPAVLASPPRRPLPATCSHDKMLLPGEASPRGDGSHPGEMALAPQLL
mgnify:CR=1 FL=1